MDFVWFVLIGIAAGWLAGRIMTGGRRGILVNLIIGVIGAVLGGWLFRLFGLKSTGLIGQLVTATVGAVLLIAILRKLGRRM